MAENKAPITAALKAKLEADKAAILPHLEAARAVYDRLVNAPELLKAKADIKRLSGELGPIENELAALARSGGAKGIKVEPGVYEKGTS